MMQRTLKVFSALAVLCLTAGCVAHARRPDYKGSRFRMIVAAETRVHVSGREMNEQEVQAEVDRLLALKPKAPVPAKVLLYEVPSSGQSHIKSARKLLQLRRDTAMAMKDALENTRLFDQIDFLPDIYLPSTSVSGLKALRIAAARAHADGLLPYSTEAGYEYEPNLLSIFYPTIVGAIVVPGSGDLREEPSAGEAVRSDL